MDIKKAEKRLYELWGEIRDLQSIDELLGWDQETYMPSGGVEARGRLMSTLAGIKHERLTAPELQEVLAACEEQASVGSPLAAQVRCARQDTDRAVRLPVELYRALAEAKSTSLAAWKEAREQSNFELFQPHLEQFVELRRREAAVLRPEGNAYDAHLHRFEPGATEEMLVPLFGDLKEALAPLVQSVVESGIKIDESAATGDFPMDRQEHLGLRFAQAIGFDFDLGRLDTSTHPFCTGIDRTDVRMTWRGQVDDFRPAVFGILHETGHGLYEQGLPSQWERTPLCDAVSLGIHESQSRLWENHVGRSRGFWHWAAPHYKEAFPNAADLQVDRLWPALHTVRPSLIRVEADEATYNLHIVVRFELERQLFSGDLEVADLSAAWDEQYKNLLGIEPSNAAEGVLQDIHWGQGMFGYFPTYTLGTMAAAQLFAAAEQELGPLEEAFTRGEFIPLLDWLRSKIHHHGSYHEAPALIEKASGRPLAADDLLTYLRQTTQEVYGLG